MSKKTETITMADLGNYVACYDCKHKDKRITELEKENGELKLKITTKNDTINFAENSYALLEEENKNQRKQIKIYHFALLDVLTTTGISEGKAEEYAEIYLDIARNKQKNT